MPPSLILSDEEYASSEDEDFAPDAAQRQDESSDSEVDDDETTRTNNKRQVTQRKGDLDGDAEDAGFANSGDEAIIERGLKRRKKKSKKGRKDDGMENDEDGDGGLVKTRSMRAQEYVHDRVCFKFLVELSN
jgi:hypothetical protein